MSRTPICGNQQSCSPQPPAYRYEEQAPTCEPATESKAPPDSMARANPAKTLLDRLSGHQEATDKFKGGQGVSPSPALEQDPRVQRYRYNAREGRYQVTKYDPKQTKLTRSGRALTGPTVKLDGRVTRLDDAIGVVQGRSQALLKATKRLEETPLGTKAVLSTRQCLPVYRHLLESMRHAGRAQALLKAGKPEEAKQALGQAARSLSDASIKARTAQRQINNNVELTVGLLKAVKAAGEAAQVVLVATGAGAAGSAAAKALGGAGGWAAAGKVGTVALVKTAHSTANKVFDQALDPDQDVDWSKVGKHAAKSMLWNLISGSLSQKLEGAIANEPALQKFLARATQKIAVSLTKTAVGMMANQAKAGKKSSPRQVATWAMSDAEAAVRRAVTDEGYDIAHGTGKALFSALLKAVKDMKAN